jgi:hypothetical protein
MNSLVDSYYAAHLSWRDLFRRKRPPSALQIATFELEECRREQLLHADRAEYHAGMVKVLDERETRLLKEIDRLSQRPASKVSAQ